jgi:hypothetical protein
MRRAVLAALLASSTAVAGTAGAVEPDDRVRPGLGYSSPVNGCTFGFLLSGSDGGRYAATAGHCALPDDGERLWLPGDGPAVINDHNRAVGRFTYAVLDSAQSLDFALIRLDRGVKGNPQMCGWGGPTRLLTEARTQPTELRQHGQAVVVSEVAPTRTAVARSLPREPYTLVHGPFAPGDSGSAVITADGAAVGQIVALTVDILTPDVGVRVVRLEHALRSATQQTGIRFTLQTAPLLPTPLPTASC